MTDMLIRDVPDVVVAALDARAGHLGLSRSEYVRRRLTQDAQIPGSPVSVSDLSRFAADFADLTDPTSWRGHGSEVLAGRVAHPHRRGLHKQPQPCG